MLPFHNSCTLTLWACLTARYCPPSMSNSVPFFVDFHSRVDEEWILSCFCIYVSSLYIAFTDVRLLWVVLHLLKKLCYLLLKNSLWLFSSVLSISNKKNVKADYEKIASHPAVPSCLLTMTRMRRWMSPPLKKILPVYMSGQSRR